MLTGQRVDHVVQNQDGEIVGVEVNSPVSTSDAGNGATPVTGAAPTSVRAKKAVIFGSGGFTHNPWMVLHYQRGPMHGGCAVITNEGDFVRIGGGVGAKMANMTGAFHAQVVFEQAMNYASVPDDVFFLPGDSSMMVNRFGVRVTSEKRNYNDRTQIHFNWDPVRGEWTNQLLFYVFDQRTADRWAGNYPIPAKGVDVPYLISGETLEELGQKIDERLSQYQDRTGGVALDESFTENFAQTVETFNSYAENGKDPEFLRGDFPYDLDWGMTPPSGEEFQDEVWPDPDQPNIALHPLAPEGPYYAVIVAGGTLTTNGGPVTNADMQVLNSEDQVIPGLYGAGTAIAAPSASAYWGGGATLGQAITTGYIAGLSAAEEPDKEV